MLCFFMVAHKPACMPNPVEGLLEVSEDMVEVLLMLIRERQRFDIPAHAKTAHSGFSQKKRLVENFH